ncbi:hypothetical protein EMCG_08934 [[Emmonsia] crescens]|uniref:DUF7770 domain-containing protein n=1 Tax=[Emmonsia] crescens TaxID=73230 RepID=A0A0G2I4N7_9EURO|nr:hypothetical protein EMCG_08934 [Emmonsia crescens UAMH 3008]
MDRLQSWTLTRFTEDDLSKPIDATRLVAYGNASTDLNPTNMWAIFLQVEETSSFRLEMVHNEVTDSAIGIMTLDHKSYYGSYNSIHNLDLSVKNGFTLRSFLDSILVNRRDKFRFTATGEGCRHWVQTVISDWEGAGLMEKGSTQKAQDTLSFYHPMDSSSESRPIIVQGTFI